MPYATDEVNSPYDAPELYRRAKYQDISDSKVLGFYLYRGEYLRKNGAPRRVSNFTVVDVIGEGHRSWNITRRNYMAYFIRLDEILTEENAPPKHFELTRITVNILDNEMLQKFGYLIGARGYIEPVIRSDDRYSEEITLHFLDAILVPPTRLLNLLDDCIARQKDWGKEHE